MVGTGPGASPIVSFYRDGKELTLGRSSEDILHIYGSTGLGLPPVSVAASDRIGGHGAVTRGVRYDVRKVFLPILIHKSTYADATEARRDLYRLLAPHLGEVSIKITDPGTGSVRAIKGLLVDGLTGDFGDDFHGNWQTLGLEFQCNSPWWESEERIIDLRLSQADKPFISDWSPFFPIVIGQATVNGNFIVNVSGDEPVYPKWTIVGPGADLVISNQSKSFKILKDFKVDEAVSIDMETGRLEPDLWSYTTLDSELFPLMPGDNTLTISMVNASKESRIQGVYRERFLEAL